MENREKERKGILENLEKSLSVVEIFIDLQEERVSPDRIHLPMQMVSIRCKEHCDTATSENNLYGGSVRNTRSKACSLRVESKMADRAFVNSF